VDHLRNVRTYGRGIEQPVSPAEDERDNLLNVEPHAQFLGNGVYGIPAGAFAWEWCADSDSSSRVHNGGDQLRHGQSV